MTVISGKNLHYAGVAAGALVGIGVGAGIMHTLGRTQEKVDANAMAKREVTRMGQQRDQLRDQLDAGLKGGEMTVNQQRDLERRIGELDSNIEARDFGSRTWSENWALTLGAAATAGGIGAALKFDRGFGSLGTAMEGATALKGNWAYKGVVTRAGSNVVFFGDARSDNVGRKVEWIAQGREKYTFAPGFVGGLAGGVAAGMLGMRMVQQFTSRPSGD